MKNKLKKKKSLAFVKELGHRVKAVLGGGEGKSVSSTSLVPRPHPLTRKGVW